jgi:hypothetical protein
VGKPCTANSQCNITGVCTSGICTAGKVGETCTTNPGCTVTGTCSSGKTCLSGTLAGSVCTGDSGCGTCETRLECTGMSDVHVVGHTGQACTTSTDCSGVGNETCDTTKRCEGGDKSGQACTNNDDCAVGGTCETIGLCQFVDTIQDVAITGGQIDTCYTTRETACDGAHVLYCDDNVSDAFAANINFPATQNQVFVPAVLQIVDSNGDPLNTAEVCAPSADSCKNEIGSFCCGLTQGAYGAPNSVATAPDGFIPSAKTAGCDVFAGDNCPNATTIGVPGTKSVTVKNLDNLINYLPAGGTPNQLNVSNDKCHYNLTSKPGNSKGDGGGSLSGQSMACGINRWLSDVCDPSIGPEGGTGFTASGFGGFKIGDLVNATLPLICTKRSGPDKVLGNTDDVCQAFLYPNCVAGKTVAEIKAAADAHLSNGANSLNCTALELANALDNINRQFDQCGNVISCVDNMDNAVTAPGVFLCPGT